MSSLRSRMQWFRFHVLLPTLPARADVNAWFTFSVTIEHRAPVWEPSSLLRVWTLNPKPGRGDWWLSRYGLWCVYVGSLLVRTERKRKGIEIEPVSLEPRRVIVDEWMHLI
uniref:Uncharacterized protein n=1 Tax=Anopheles darlingi TaxID=43151 RepID=A0A2M4DRR1_ANODA